jgi:hypothetical protein
VHRADYLHRTSYIVFALRGKFCRRKNLLRKKLNLVASQFVDMLTTHTRRRLRKNLHSRAVCESALFLSHRPRKKFLELPVHKTRKIFIHPACLFP